MKEPKIRFKGFKGEWENTPFSETFDSLKNNSLSRAELSDSGEVMNIHYGDVLIKYGECVDVIKEVETFVKDEEVAKKLHQSCAIKNGDVIFADAAEDNAVGKCSEVIANENDAIVSGLHTIACRPKKDFAPMYLGYYLNSNAYHDQLLPHIQGTKISSISKKAISQTHINSPLEKDEQQSIASYFQHLDSLIQLTTKKIESLKQVKAASLQSMFPQEGETTPRVRFKGFNGEWENEKIGNFSTSFSGGTPTAGVPAYYGGNIPFIRSGEIHEDKTELSLTEKGYNNSSAKIVEKGTLLYALYGATSGDVAISKIRGAINQAILAITPYILVETDFLADFLLCNKIKIVGELLQGGQGNLSGSLVKDINVAYPCISEQRAIASYFTTLDRQITLLSQRLEKLKQIKAACLDNMFV